MPRDSEKRWCNVYAASTELFSSKLVIFWLLSPKEARGTGVNLMARILRERVLRNRSEAPGGSRDYSLELALPSRTEGDALRSLVLGASSVALLG
jgi:hypothetical protein